MERNHYKCLHETEIDPTDEDKKEIAKLIKENRNNEYFIDSKASTNWYRLDKDIWICDKNKIVPLSQKSSIVNAMIEKPQQKRFYAN